jgi:hypothetical protein
MSPPRDGVLIVCRDQTHCAEARLAFGRDYARYEAIGGVLCGARFSKIIVIVGEPRSAVEAQEYERIIRHELPAKLALQGELYVL